MHTYDHIIHNTHTDTKTLVSRFFRTALIKKSGRREGIEKRESKPSANHHERRVTAAVPQRTVGNKMHFTLWILTS